MMVEGNFYTSFERIVAAGAIQGNHDGKAKDYNLQDKDMAIKNFFCRALNDGPNHGNFYPNFKQEVRFILTRKYYLT